MSPYMGTGSVTLKYDPRVLPVGRFLRSNPASMEYLSTWKGFLED